ncbi:Multidrug resistance protein MdtA [bioreactor metagenome]|uniref:Multidrug resistance protein MdtA n=1 Tax=bioreactor metagenome TaxID=1076179 RepID=A0A645CTT8_9ZZZZ|nr:efflux RND transporter periplasmic adaptor subunit [Rikenellaceae bacterium]
MNKSLIFICLCILLASCKNSNQTQNNREIQYKGDTIIVGKDAPALKNLIITKTRLKNYSTEFRSVGTVRPVSGKIAEILPPFAGRIVKSRIRLGQKINIGSAVFELGSSDFYDAAKSYFAAKSANELAIKNYNRQKDLVVNGVASQKDLEQAQNEASITGQEFEQAKATLKVFNIDAASLQMGQPLKVVSPISGEVIKYNITIGSYVKEDSEPLAVIADLSHVWVVALVKEKYFGSIKHGDRVEVYTDANPSKTIWGTIYHIGEVLDEETRSLEVIIECNNADRDLKIGMFCEVHFINSPVKAVILPATAIMKKDDNDCVLIEINKGQFLRRKVEIETANTDSVRILSGIGDNENVIIKGGILLNM